MCASSVYPLEQSHLVLETERLRLRPLSLEDYGLMAALQTDPQVMQYIGGPVPVEAIPEKLETSVRRGAGGRIGVWCIEDRGSGEKLGTALLLPLPIEAYDADPSQFVAEAYPNAETEVGYTLLRPAWGRGIATEACRRLLKFGFEETSLGEIVAVTHSDNLVSQKVLTKCGLRPEGMRRAYCNDVPGFRITRAQWLALENS
jgi:ribosomal-protein-alanine N-acetyltransferase